MAMYNDSKSADMKQNERPESAGANSGKYDNKKKKKRNYKRRNYASDSNVNSREDKLSSLNDLSWYSKNPTLLMAAGSFPYPYRPGMRVTLDRNSVDKKSDQYTIPGIAVLSWIPTVGYSEVATDPINIAAREIYAKVRSAYSGSLEVDAPDFLIYMMALDSVYSYIGALKRIYRTLNTYSPDNYTLPDDMLVAMGIKEDDIIAWKQNQMSLFQYINELIAMVSKFSCPAVMDIFNRHYWMNDNVYADAPTASSQFYVFKEQQYWMFSLIEDSNKISAGGLVPYIPTMTNPQTAFNSGIELISALAESDDAYTINGYFMRAFGDVPSFMLAPLTYDEKLEPVYVEEVLTQIENSTTLPLDTEIEAFNITQNVNTNCIVAKPVTKKKIYDGNKANQSTFAFAATMGMVPANTLTIRSDLPTVADSVIASRLKIVLMKAKGDSAGYYMPIYCGTEIPIKWTLISKRYDPMTDSSYIEKLDVPSVAFNDVTISTKPNILPLAFSLRQVGLVTQFDWHPLIQLWDIDTVSTGLTFKSVPYLVGDIHNLTTIGEDELKNLHKVCIYSEFNAFSIL